MYYLVLLRVLFLPNMPVFSGVIFVKFSVAPIPSQLRKVLQRKVLNMFNSRDLHVKHWIYIFTFEFKIKEFPGGIEATSLFILTIFSYVLNMIHVSQLKPWNITCHNCLKQANGVNRRDVISLFNLLCELIYIQAHIQERTVSHISLYLFLWVQSLYNWEK